MKSKLEFLEQIFMNFNAIADFVVCRSKKLILNYLTYLQRISASPEFLRTTQFSVTLPFTIKKCIEYRIGKCMHCITSLKKCI